jgi:hypothetical protein
MDALKAKKCVANKNKQIERLSFERGMNDEVSVTNLSGERVSQVALGCHVFEPEWSLAVEMKDGRYVVPKALSSISFYALYRLSSS